MDTRLIPLAFILGLVAGLLVGAWHERIRVRRLKAQLWRIRSIWKGSRGVGA